MNYWFTGTYGFHFIAQSELYFIKHGLILLIIATYTNKILMNVYSLLFFSNVPFCRMNSIRSEIG